MKSISQNSLIQLNLFDSSIPNRKDKHCQFCGKIIPRDKLPPCEYRKRLYCNRVCRNRGKNVITLHKRNELHYQEAIQAYLASPNKCLYCNSIIPLESGHPLSETLKKKFCNQSCAGSYNNNLPTRKTRKEKQRICNNCGGIFYGEIRAFCSDCWGKYRERVSGRTKEESNAREIRANSASFMNGRERICQHCGYSKFVEICHIKAVSSFPKTAKVREINDPSNLIYLCPNCHWELDHGIIAVNDAG